MKNVHSSIFPNNVQSLVSRPSGCGKTVFLFHLVVQKEGLKFTSSYKISQSLEQEKYRNLIEVLDKVGDEFEII